MTRVPRPLQWQWEKTRPSRPFSESVPHPSTPHPCCRAEHTSKGPQTKPGFGTPSPRSQGPFQAAHLRVACARSTVLIPEADPQTTEPWWEMGAPGAPGSHASCRDCLESVQACPCGHHQQNTAGPLGTKPEGSRRNPPGLTLPSDPLRIFQSSLGPPVHVSVCPACSGTSSRPVLPGPWDKHFCSTAA